MVSVVCFWNKASTEFDVDPTFFPGRAATIYYRRPTAPASTLETMKRVLSISEDEEIGVLGILHPSVLENFEVSYPCSAVEFSLEPFRRTHSEVWSNS